MFTAREKQKRFAIEYYRQNLSMNIFYELQGIIFFSIEYKKVIEKYIIYAYIYY